MEQRIIKLASLGLAHSDICVLTPYNKQCSLVRYLLRKINMSDVSKYILGGVATPAPLKVILVYYFSYSVTPLAADNFSCL